MKDQGGELPMSEQEFRSTLDPVAIVNNRATTGGPQPAEMERMVKGAQLSLSQQEGWIKERRGRIDAALTRLDSDFKQLLNAAR
ncbi:Argininosuccinate lyase [Oxalobacteraceae bacterium IMCC9480]|nr:Argininosuccinate lyase [Oxalobacteraceae bacterium IMCC9480]